MCMVLADPKMLHLKEKAKQERKSLKQHFDALNLTST